MNQKSWKHKTVLFFLCGIILISFQNDSKPAQEGRKDLWLIIQAAVEDNTWWDAKNRQELKKILSQYYAGPLLEELSTEAWNFISQPTDWYSQTQLLNIKFKEKTSELIEVEASLKDTDSASEEVKYGRARYILHKTKQGWRIFSADYQWQPGEDDI